MEIRQCENQEQLKQLADLADVIWHEYFVSLLSKEQIDYMVEKFQSYDAIDRAIKEEGYTYFLAYEEQTLIGYMGVKLEEKRLFLSKLYLRKDKRGQGLASILLQKAVDYAIVNGKQSIYLTCNKYNQHSLDVHHRKGFYDIDAVVSDIGHVFVMDDYILQKDL